MKEYDFYIVPTPIGNLGDITVRAIDTLKSVDLIACEDSRVTQKLLNHFGIKTKCISYHKFNEKERTAKLLEIIQSGKKAALVSDAGTPLFCDPGSILAEELRSRSVKITALPGANAAATFLSQIARKNEDFYFAGFMPRTKDQTENLITKFKHTDLVFYESPNRILKTLKTVKDCRPNSRAAIGRELTKFFEEIKIGGISEITGFCEENPPKGEITGLIFREADSGCDLIEEKIAALKSKNFKAKEISVIISELYNISRNEVYKAVIENE
ncbi:MAG: 16S rRNA (cytidine(1402)-2'-O)-methyltransferase [Heliobacteriaceae bacterium]|jgi:16S rRNA (cytidine1402-2'-O)-methyltransferase|nr:16S rRNA (cytidine(1402)-2'-O)-methyltransferase [Heliobacteriaceae bacterium]